MIIILLQTFHAIVVVAALIHYMGLLEMSAFHKTNSANTTELLFLSCDFNQSTESSYL